MSSRHALMSALIVVGLIAAVIINFRDSSRDVGRAILNDEDTYFCAACGEEFNMTGKEAMSLVRRGKTDAKPHQMAAFPCKKCGEAKATVRSNKYEE